jgi:hypothetical protein
LEDSITQEQIADTAAHSGGNQSLDSKGKTQKRVQRQNKKGGEPSRLIRFSKEQIEKILAVGIPRPNALGLYYTEPTSGELRIVIRGTKASNSPSQISTQGLSNEQIAEMATNMAMAEANVKMKLVPGPVAPELGVNPKQSPRILDELQPPLFVTQEGRVAFTAGPHYRATTASPNLNEDFLDANAGDESTEEHKWWMETDQEAGIYEIDRLDWDSSR